LSERPGWGERVRELGDSLLAVVRAEITAIVDDLSRSGRALVRALVLLAIAAGVGFWTIGLILDFAVELLAIKLPRWQAVGIVLALFLIVVAVLILIVRRRLRGIEAPAATVRRRLDDSRRWWQEKVVGDDDAEDPE
jgi:Putative Actinobacterial Holin-X, holin superfamily III